MQNWRAEFESILRRYGHNIYLQKRLPGTDGYGKDAFEARLTKHTVRYTHPGIRGLGAIQEEQFEGVINSSDRIYYFKWDANPHEGDRIYEIDPSFPRNSITFFVDYALPMRGQGGQLVYWAVGSSRETPN